MFCTKCGKPVAQDSAFCSYCGNAVLPYGAAPPPPYTAAPNWQPPAYPEQPSVPPSDFYAPSAYSQDAAKKKKVALTIGLAALGAVLLIVLALFVWPGVLKAATVAGVWYSDTRGEAIVFGEGQSFDAHTYYGEFTGDYEFDKNTAKGHIEMSDDRQFDFEVKGDSLYVENMGVFVKASGGFDIDEFIEEVSK